MPASTGGSASSMKPNPSGSSPRGRADVPGERPELLQPVGVARAVAHDEEGGRRGGRLAAADGRHGRQAHAEPQAATRTATAAAGAASASTQAAAPARAARPTAGMLPA